ncbi:protein of unknown function (plasmid) [Vibrio harveyi]|nr:protein of unknown function [Vibrio harveyi]
MVMHLYNTENEYIKGGNPPTLGQPFKAALLIATALLDTASYMESLKN